MRSQIDGAVKSFSKADTSSLYAKLGAYSTAFSADPAQFAVPDAAISVDENIAGPLDDAIALGKRILRRWNKAIFDLVCGKDDVDPQVKKTIMDALALNSPEALSAAITGVLIGVFSVGPAVAAVVGVLFGKVLFPEAGKEVCSFWKERL